MGGVRVFRVVARRVVLLHLLPIAFWTVSVVLVLFTVAFLLVAAADLLELVDELGFKRPDYMCADDPPTTSEGGSFGAAA